MWKESDNKLIKEFVFKNFVEATGFVTRVSIISEKFDHHPEINILYDKVIIKLSTHDLGNIISEKDYALSKQIDNLI